MGGIPGTKKRRWYGSDAFTEAVTNIPPILTAFIAAASLRADDKRPAWIARVAFLGAAWLSLGVVLRIVRARQKDRDRAALESPQDLLGCVHVLYGQLCQRCGIGEDNHPRLRITVHRVVPPANGEATQSLEQVIPYVGDKGGKAGRYFTIKSGLIGLAVRENAPFVMKWDGTDPAEFIRELKTKYNYTNDEADRLVTYRRSWFAVPISGKRENEVIGVMFLDSGDPEFFNDEVRSLIIHAGFGIANYIRERYA